MTYGPRLHWAVDQPQTNPPEQEAALMAVLGRYPATSVIDVGCGKARLLPWLVGTRRYTGIDLSMVRLYKASLRLDSALKLDFLDSAELIWADFREWNLPENLYDLAIASQFLMHVPPEDIEDVVGKLLFLAPVVITLDWTEPIEKPVAPHNFLHDYRGLFERHGDRPVRETKIGKQTLFEVTL